VFRSRSVELLTNQLDDFLSRFREHLLASDLAEETTRLLRIMLVFTSSAVTSKSASVIARVTSQGSVIVVSISSSASGAVVASQT